MYTCNDKAFTFTFKVTDLISKRTIYILCCILCCIWISLHYYLYANYNAGGTHGSCHFLIIAFLMGDFLVYFFSNNTNKLRFLSVVLNWMWYVCQIGRFKGDLSVSDHYLSCTTYIYIQDNDSLIGQQWIVVTYLYWYTLIIIFILFINCILMLLLYIYTMPCLLRVFKIFYIHCYW